MSTRLGTVLVLVLSACAGNPRPDREESPDPDAGSPGDDAGSDAGADACCPGCVPGEIATGCPCDAVEEVACYSGPEETVGIGACSSGTRACEDGIWGPCAGEVLPADEERFGRNAIDDDCNGAIDDGLCGDVDDCGGLCCTDGESCSSDRCGSPDGCSDDGDCDEDSGCAADGTCVPYADGATREDCSGSGLEPGVVEASLECQWTGGVVTTQPLVVDLDADGGSPEVIVSASGPDDLLGGRLVAIRGDDCAERWRSDGPEVMYDAQPAVGDLDGDGHVEIAVRTAGDFLSYGGLAIFDDEGHLVCESAGAGFPPERPATIANLDGVGDAEILMGGRAWDSSCEERFRIPTDVSVYVVADVDLDGAPEIVTGSRIYGAADGDEEARFDDLDDGEVAVADFDPATPEPEIAVVAPSGVRIQTAAGDVVFGPWPIPGAPEEWTSAPTVGDFDGDGQPELGVPGPDRFLAYDPDCQDGWVRDGGTCNGGADGLLWERSVVEGADASSAATAFDLDGDGTMEVIAGDECFLRIHDGATGEVWSATARAGGWQMGSPVVADADGDGRTEVVIGGIGDVWGCGLDDPYTATAWASTDAGVQIWREIEDRWAPARRVWNQNAYSVTNVEDDGRIPAVALDNWDAAGRNDFRVNSGGAVEPGPTPGIDLTVRGDGFVDACPGHVTLRAIVANRGLRDAPRGIPIAFHAGGPPERGGVLVCRAWTTRELAPGETESIACDDPFPGGDAVDVWIRVDDGDSVDECEEDNGDGFIVDVRCDG